MSDWHKSSYSGGTNECVEAREHETGADVRDTQNRELGYLSFTRAEWNAFVETTLHSHR
ncbi:hypothetical protein GCM10007079_47080 [Nocardiopsis terrae]|uniref:DUF397 domain-containing protein n=1 Tax=Nocardiopsis terrae TaxID=372655 RepID=A0ABR9HKD4_9ACTN|nr:DUF397 domain-containing protein [Nocardiopsis terrae]MBE1459481.1 hypothetical protein [Nocardiopsis terrae]GHC95413.1 hypothetical protein GCM10007079_47080 [Nocardiopsis terrae]